MRRIHLYALGCGAVAAMMAATAFAQQPAPVAPPPAAAQPQLPAWDSFPQMLLERIYRGPMKDTIIQRLRDPIDGTVCYVYLPISVAYQPKPGDYVQYGANSVGTISCIHPSEVLQLYERPPTQTQPAGNSKPH